MIDIAESAGIHGEPSKLRIIVAVTTCDPGRFLQSQLESIASQDRTPDALIVSDDASVDGTIENLRAFAETAPFPVTLLMNPKRVGVHQNWAKALAAAATLGEVVVPADHDDVWSREKLTAIEKVFVRRRDISLWFSDADLIDENGAPIGVKLSELVTLDSQALADFRAGQGVRRLLHGGTISGCQIALRADVIPLAVPFPEALDGRYPYFYPDAWIALVARLLGEFETDERCLVHYRRHPGQVSERSSADYESRPRSVDRRHALNRDRAATALLAARIRERPQAGWDRHHSELVFALDDFFSARTTPRGTRGRTGALLSHWRSGAYSRFARGTRTFAADLFASDGPAPGV